MNTLRNPWVLALLAVVLGVGAQAGFFFMKLGASGGEEHEAAPQPAYAPQTISWSFISPAVNELQAELEQRLAAVATREK
ncbi:MAG: hypothetical protein ACREIA_25780, partial [Opitutaceae bacterium]